MKFIKKKNLGGGEEILCIPQLHWLYIVKPLLYSLPFFLILLAFWFTDDTLVSTAEQMGYNMLFPVKLLVRQVFLAGFLLILVIFICRILKYINTEYGITNKRLIIKRGIINLAVAEIPTDRIESIYCSQGLLGRIFHYGTVKFAGIGGMMPVFFMVARPYALRRKIVNIIERNKNITIVHGDIPVSKAAAKPRKEPEPEPLYRYGTFVRVLPDSDYIPLS